MMKLSQTTILYLFVISATLVSTSVYSEILSIENATEFLESPSKDIYIERTSDEMNYRIQNRGNEIVFIPVLELDTLGIDNCQLQYSARVRSEELTKSAYLEMHCVIDGSSFFSKALNDVFSGDMNWKNVSTPFLLKKGEHAQKVIMGVYFEGPGVIYLENITLRQIDATVFGNFQGNWQWIPGTLFGVLAGLYGGFVGLNAQKGRAKALVYGVWILFVCISILMLIAGIVLLSMGQPYANWYAFLLPGVLGVAIFSPMIVTLNRAYHEAEARKMHAKDVI